MYFLGVGILLLPQLVPQLHPVERALEVDQVHQHRGLFAGIGRQEIKSSRDTAGLTDRIRGNPVTLVIALNGRAKPGAGIDEHVITTAVCIPV